MNVVIEEDPPRLDAAVPKQAELGVALLGCGVVGSAVARLLAEHSDRLAARLGRRPVIRAVVVRDLEKPRAAPIERSLFSTSPIEAVDRDDVDVVIEVMGGLHPASAVIELALLQGKHVVTANKELLARRRHCLDPIAAGSGRRLLYEASVMAGVPVVDTLARLASGDVVTRLEGVLNGTTNYCLHRMEESGIGLDEALEEARDRGFAEADPTADVDGEDAAAKLAILASIAFGRNVRFQDVEVAGIRGIGPKDISALRAGGETIRLVAEARQEGSEVAAHVAPRRLPVGHPLAQVEGHHNALAVETVAAGRLFFHGPGAGGEPTASAVLRDLAALIKEGAIQ